MVMDRGNLGGVSFGNVVAGFKPAAPPLPDSGNAG
jgi:hypothetical protein